MRKRRAFEKEIQQRSVTTATATVQGQDVEMKIQAIDRDDSD